MSKREVDAILVQYDSEVKADYLSQNSASESINYIKDEQIYFKFIEVVEYDEDGIWIFTRLKNLIKGSLQIVFSKSNNEESQYIIRWEVREETSLKLP